MHSMKLWKDGKTKGVGYEKKKLIERCGREILDQYDRKTFLKKKHY